MKAKLIRQSELSFLFGIIWFLVMSCDGSITSKDEKPPNYSQKDLEGDWKLIQKRVVEEKQSIERYKKNAQPDVAQEWTPQIFLDKNGVLRPDFPKEYLSTDNQDLSVLNDSISSIEYPLQLHWKNSYTIKENKLIIGKEKDAKSIWLSASKDTLRISYLDYYGLYLEETYLKTSFDDEVLTILHDYKTNFPELAATWHLIRKDALEWGEQYELDFPHTVPDSIVLTREELESTLHSDRSIQMITDGKKMKYYLGYDEGELLLTPGEWYDMNYYHDKGFTGDQKLFFRKTGLE